MNFPCLFIFHKWKVINVFNYYDVSFEQFPCHSLQLQCNKCGKVKMKKFWGCGFTSINQFNDDEEG